MCENKNKYNSFKLEFDIKFNIWVIYSIIKIKYIMFINNFISLRDRRIGL